MKVVLFCGGRGLRLREYSEAIPKPMVPVGNRPILWHVMRYFAEYGHGDFVLCLGYRAEVIKEYFLRYNEAVSNDFVLSQGGRSLEFLSTDIEDWRITFADTGLAANVGSRLRAVRRHLGDDEMFLANYGDTLTDAPLAPMIEAFERSDAIAAFLAIRPTYTFHLVDVADDGRVTKLQSVEESGTRINGGYFIFRRGIFDVLKEAEELVEAPFHRLMDQGKLMAFTYDGFWAPMDTLKDKQDLDAMWDAGNPPWAVWRRGDEVP
ncbi:MAG: sugar phosphate nucleotidyltransferase [Candidatus Limnocylindrales bacterium]